MPLRDDVTSDIQGPLLRQWDVRTGTVVPELDGIALGPTSGVNLLAAVLYSDLADSTALAMANAQMAARIFKAFLASSTRIIRSCGGEIRSFDGDRVMGVFVGENSASAAAGCGLQINCAFTQILKPKFEAQYPVLQGGTKLVHCTGVDFGNILVVRAGVRNNNDLVWVGRSPNVAAKLSAIRDTPYHTFVTGEVYDRLNTGAKFGSDGKDIWELRDWNTGPVKRVYRSHYIRGL